ncbi:hypothetical protein C8A03DRAFT_47411 [Achaetomium macrosporum]|uniref:Uncharacterized protein n=1 Tax=Achaetomium macrosporum TaxID=79813 RepID=A0AAN7C369_9PEZI|nr:hypothetical protein C8A03DRAFT_47411 [Achaetomium macrosporum]
MAHQLDSQTTPLSPLLRLSPRIRRRIYYYVGLASWGSPYKFSLATGAALKRAPNPSCFHGLLLSCRAIYQESAALLYSANQFIASLLRLRALTARSLQSLSNLTIVLHEESCRRFGVYASDWLCCVHGRASSWGSEMCLTLEHNDNNKLTAAQALLDEWHSTAAHLLSHATPGRLVLSVICDMDPRHPRALGVAKSIVAPIRLLPPSYLRACHIRLARKPDHRLQQLAQDAVLEACGIGTPSLKPPSNATAATLTTLPRELCIRILEYNDLVTPRREVTWSRQDRGYMLYNRGHNKCHSAQFFNCWFGQRTNCCFCRRRHAAFSLTCKCWAPPGPTLFLVCCALYEDAQFVFFSSNRFIVHDFNYCAPWDRPCPPEPEEDQEGPTSTYPYPNERLAVSQFLREVVPVRSLSHLRFLELLLPPYRPPNWPGIHHPAMTDWRATLDWLRGKINPPGLTLRLMVADLPYKDLSWEPDDMLISFPNDIMDCYHDTITIDEGEAIMKAYMDFLQRALMEAITPDVPNPHIRKGDPRERALKKCAERYVMGDRYKTLYANDRKEPQFSDRVDLFRG